MSDWNTITKDKLDPRTSSKKLIDRQTKYYKNLEEGVFLEEIDLKYDQIDHSKVIRTEIGNRINRLIDNCKDEDKKYFYFVKQKLGRIKVLIDEEKYYEATLMLLPIFDHFISRAVVENSKYNKYKPVEVQSKDKKDFLQGSHKYINYDNLDTSFWDERHNIMHGSKFWSDKKLVIKVLYFTYYSITLYMVEVGLKKLNAYEIVSSLSYDIHDNIIDYIDRKTSLSKEEGDINFDSVEEKEFLEIVECIYVYTSFLDEDISENKIFPLKFKDEILISDKESDINEKRREQICNNIYVNLNHSSDYDKCAKFFINKYIKN